MKNTDSEIINRVANSSLVQLDMEDWFDKRKRFQFDLADFLYQGLVLKELDFRAVLKSHDWQQYKDAHLAVGCSADAIVPTWAFMLVAGYATGIAASITFGTVEDIDNYLFDRWISALSLEQYRDQKVIVKGCSQYPVPVSAYVSVAAKLTPVVQSLMFGEPCSNVPLFKRKTENTSLT